MATPRHGDALFIGDLGRAAATRMRFSLIFLRDLGVRMHGITIIISGLHRCHRNLYNNNI